MAKILGRRVMLLSPLFLAACGGGEDEVPAPVAARRDFPPLRYAYLPPIKLNVARVEMAEGFVPPTGDDEIIGTSPINPVDTLYAMARDRLKPAATGGTAEFRVLTTSVTRRHDTLNGELAVRLDVHDADNTNSGFAEARVTAVHTGPITDPRASVYDILKTMMFDMNVELEYQIRNKLRTWVADAPTQPPAAARTAPAVPVDSGDKPPTRPPSSPGPQPLQPMPGD